jgi:hypothetical protein
MAGRSAHGAPSVRWDFDPGAIARAESDAWVTYYRHEWGRMLSASVRLVHHGFRMNPANTLLGAWYVLRANMKWAPYPDNDPDGATEEMRRFFGLVIRPDTPDRNARTAAVREVAWWRAHREHQHRFVDEPSQSAGATAGAEADSAPGQIATSARTASAPGSNEPRELVEALAESYAYVYQVGVDSVREAARLRAEAMDISDVWVAAGRDREDVLLARERQLLLQSYAALLDAVRKSAAPESANP